MQNSSDVNIPPPQSTPTQPAQSSPSSPPADQSAPAPGQSTLIDVNNLPGPKVLTPNQIIIGAAISLALAVLFWFLGRIVADTLIKQFAEVGAAKRAGIALSIFLSVVGLSVTFGVLGDYWFLPPFFLSTGSLTLLTFGAFIFSLVAANRSKRK